MKRRFSGPSALEWSWATYDFANSSYALLVMGVAYQLYFKQVVFAADPGRADAVWGAVVAGSIVTSAFVAVLAGRSADRRSNHRAWLRLMTVVAVLATGALSVVMPGAILAACVVFWIANAGYNVALAFYDMFLPAVAAPARVSTVSGLGWGFGYVGGIACLALTIHWFGQDLAAGGAGAFRTGFVLVALFFGAFALPSLIMLPRSAGGRVPTAGGAAPAGEPARSSERRVWRFIVAYYFISDVVLTIIYFSANYLATTFGLSPTRILVFTLVIQAIAFPATWTIGAVAKRWTLRRSLMATLAVWVVIVVLLAFGRGMPILWTLCVLLGVSIGSTQALGRARLAELVPASSRGRFFGWNAFSSKIAASLGPLVFGFASSITGNQRWGWLSLLPFLAVGAWLLGADRDRGTDG